jgi:hypothetical protein
VARSTSAIPEIRRPDDRLATRTPRRAGATLALTLAASTLAACGTASHPTGPGGSLYARLVDGYLAYARCARSHGMPDLPDPQVDAQGNDHYPSLDRLGPWRWPESVLTGCASVWDRVHAIRDAYDSAHQPPAATPTSRAQGVAFAACIRRHGFPTYPDPSSGGGTPAAAVPPGFIKPNISPQAEAAIRACVTKRP